MAGMKTLFTGPPKPKKPKVDKEAENRLKEQDKLERERADSAERALQSSRRARRGQGLRRGGLAYVPPGAGGPGNTLG